MKILAIDPSGNFTEGKGTTGWSLLDENLKIITCGQKLAIEYTKKEEYWKDILALITELKPDILVVEDFLLYASKSNSQINSRFETPKLIGIIELYAYNRDIPIYLQRAVDVKNRWTDEILVNKNIISKVNNRYYASGVMISEHIRDSIRHGVHFIKYKLKKGNQNGS